MISLTNFFLKDVFLPLLVTVMSCTFSIGMSSLQSNDSTERVNLWPECQVLEDKRNTLTINDILEDSIQRKFRSTAGISSMFGFTSSAYWVKFRVPQSHRFKQRYLTIERVSLWEADLYFINQKGEIVLQNLGVNTPFYERPFRSNFVISELHSSMNEEYYVKVSAITSLFIPIYIDTTQSLVNRLTHDSLVTGLYIGIFTIIILYNLLSFAFRKKPVYGWYLFYVVSLFVYQGLFNTGLGFEYLWPNWPQINKYYVVSSSVFGISMLLFSAKFLEIREGLPKLYHILKPLVVAFVAMMCICLLGYPSFSSKYFFWLLAPTLLYLLVIGIMSFKQGNANARFYLAGWGVFMVFYFIFALWLNGFIGESVLGQRALVLGSFFEMIFWFSAVSDKVSTSRRLQQQQEIVLRKEVARDFHDELGNQVARLINYVGLLRMRGSIPPDIYEPLNSFAQNILDGAKDFVWTLDPSNNNLNNTMIHIKDFGEQLLSEKNISFRFYKTGNDQVGLAYGHSRQIILIFKEAITNVFKHSEATAVEIRIDMHPGSAVISLRDNGKGIPEKVLTSSPRGLANIRARSAKIQAPVKFFSDATGTVFSLEISTRSIN